jgi:hypothetical protein
MMKDQQQESLTADEQSFLLPISNNELNELQEDQGLTVGTDRLQAFVQGCEKCGFPTPLLTRYLQRLDVALNTWADATQCKNKDDLAFSVTASLSSTTKRKYELIIIRRIGEKAAALWLARPNVQALLAEIAAGKQAIKAHDEALTEKVAEVVGFTGDQPSFPNVREWLAGGRTDATLLESTEERLEAAQWF